MTERQDTRRNRAALISAARQRMVADGMNTPTKAIARTAGLGSATLYRHFPTRVDLLTAVFGEEIDHCRAELSRATGIPDPWEALAHLLHTVAATELSVPGLAAALQRGETALPAYDALWKEAHGIIDSLAARLRAGGARPDLRRQDLWLLLQAVRAATASAGKTDARDADRLISLLVDGLR